MKKSLKIFVALFALLITTAGFSSNAQPKQSTPTATQTTAVNANIEQATAYYYVGYLNVSITGDGYITVGYTDPNGNLSFFGVIGGAHIEAMPGTTCSINAAHGSILSSVSGDTEIRAHQTSYVTVSAYKVLEK